MKRAIGNVFMVLAIGTTAEAAQIPPKVAENRCEGKPKGAACWQELVNHPECRIWTEFFEPGSRVSWSGKCKSGLAQREGVLQGGSHIPPEPGRPDGESHSIHEKGNLKDGKKHGWWVEERFDGMHASRSKGSYVDGKRRGRWVEDFGGDVISEGPYVDGEKHGHWLTKYSHGLILEGPYFQGKKHGQWVVRYADGTFEEGPYFQGKEHGQWVVRRADGTVEHVTFENGERVRTDKRR